MTTRSIVVALRADVADFRRQMGSAAESTTKAMDQVGLAMGAVGVAAGAAVALSVEKWAQFDQQMSAVQAATHETTANMDRLAAASLAAGADTVFSATDAARAVEELAKAGVSTQAVLGGGLQGALDLASAGTLDVGEAAETAASAMTQFKLSGQDVPHIADLLAAGAGKAQGSVHDMGMALSQVGLVASQTGLSIEETTGGLAAFAAAGLTGSDAGTSMKTMLQALTPSSVEAAKTMEQLGISAYDSQGNFIGLASFAGNLKESLAGLSVEQQNAALKTIFGSDAVRAAAVLYSDGANGIQSWIDKTNDAGYAQETAALKLDNLKGDLEALGGAWDTAAIKTGKASDGLLRGGVQGITALVDAYGEMGGTQQAVVLGGAAVVAAVGLVGGAALLAVPKIIEMRASLQLLGTTAPRTATALKGVGLAAGGAMAALALLMAIDMTNSAMADTVVASSEETTAALLKVGTSIEDVNKIIAGTSQKNDRFTQWDSLAEAATQLTDPSTMDRINDVFGEITSLGSNEGSEGRTALVEQLRGIGDALGDQVNSGHADMAAQQFAVLAEEWQRGGGTVEELKALLPGYTDALTGVANGQEIAAQSGDQVTSALTGVTGTAEDTEDAIKDLTDALDRILSSSFDVEAATDNYSEALLKLKDAAKDNGRELEGNTEGALANREAMRGLAEDGFKVIEAMAKQGASAEELTKRSAELKQSFIDQATAAGFPKAAVERYAATFDLIPAQIQTLIATAGADTAQAQLDGILRKVQQLDGRTVTTYFQTKGDANGLSAQAVLGGAGKAVARARGGSVFGPGTATSDSIPALLSNGEHVWSAAEVSAAGGHAAVESMRATVLSNPIRRAAGGSVGSNPGALVNTGMLLSALGSAPGPVTDDRYVAALRAEAVTAAAAAEAEARLNALRKSGRELLEGLKASLSDAEDAAKEQRDAAVDGMSDQLDALKERHSAELSAARERKASTAQVNALKARQGAQESAAEDAIAAAKKRNEQAAKDLGKANDRLIDQAEERQAGKEERAELSLTAAKDQAAAATDELRDSEDELNDARQRAISLAQQVASAVAKNAGLGTLLGDGRSRSAKASAADLADALAAVDTAGRKVRGESASAALERQRKALADLASAGDAYAASQEALGATPQAVQAGLQQTIDKIRELGGAYGLAAGDVDKLTSSLTDRAAAGSDLMANMEAEAQRAEELRDNIKLLVSAGLNTTSLDQVIGEGTDGGLALSRKLLAGGAAGIGQVNNLQGRISAAGADLGSYVSNARYAPDAQEIKVAPITISGGSLKVDGSLVALSEAVGLDYQTVAAMTTAFVAAARQIPAPVVNVTNVTQAFAKAP